MTDTEFVYNELSKIGIDVRSYQVQIHDVELNTIMLLGGKNITRKTTGLAIHKGHRHYIYLLSSLNKVKRQGVLAHELGHVWLWEHRSPLRNSLSESEGFCELLAYKLYGAINTPEARLLRRGMLLGRTPVYSNGFRTMKRRAESMGWENYLSAADGLPHNPIRIKSIPHFVIHNLTKTPFRIVNTSARPIKTYNTFTISNLVPETTVIRIRNDTE